MAQRGPISGNERVAVLQGDNLAWATKAQVTAILAAQDRNPGKPPMNRWTAAKGDETFLAIQGGQRVYFTAADLTAWLAAPGSTPEAAGGAALTTITGAEILPVTLGSGDYGYLDIGDVLGVTGGTPTPTPTPSPTTLFASRQNMIASLTDSAGSLEGFFWRTAHVFAGDWTECAPVYYNWRTSAQTQGHNNGPNDYTLTAVVAVYNGVAVNCLFSGATNKLVAAGAGMTPADTLTPDMFGATVFSSGAQIFFKAKGTLPSGGGSVVRSSNYNNSAGPNNGAYYYNPADTLDISGPGASPTSPPSAVTTIWAPHCWLIGKPANSDQECIFLDGDSFVDTYGAPQTAVADLGLPSWNGGVTASYTEMGIASTNYQEAMGYCNRAFIWKGTNDLNTAFSSTSITNLTTRAGQMRTKGITRIVVGEMLNRTTTTDDYATVANQTEVSGFTVGGRADQFNTALAAQVGSGSTQFNAIAVTKAPLSDGTVASKWPANGSANAYTSDGKHPGGLSLPIIRTAFITAYNGGVSRPINTVASSVAGVAVQGETLTISVGTWLYSPTGYSAQRQRLISGVWTNAGSPVTGAGPTLTDTVVAGDVGYKLRYVVTATNATGSSTSRTEATSVVTSGYSFANAEAAALVARMTVAPTNGRKAAIDNFVGAMKSCGYWALADAVYVGRAHDRQAARLNWKSASYDLTEQGTLSFVADQGFTSDGSTGYLSTGFVPSTAGGGMAQDSTHLLAVGGGEIAEANAIVGDGAASGNRTRLVPRNASNVASLVINSASAGSTSATITTSDNVMVVGLRTASTATVIYRNKSSITPTSTTSAGLPAQAIEFLRASTTFSTRQLRMGGFGAGVGYNTTMRDAMVDALAAYVAAL